MMDRTSYGIFIFVLIFSPLAFGAVEQWSLTVMEGLSVLACLLFLFGNRGKATFHEIPGIVPLTLFLAYMLIQIIPLPAGIIKALSPETYALLGETAAEGGALKWASLSINRKATLAEFFRIAACAAFYVLTVQLLTKRDLLKKTVAIIAVFAACLSFFAILQHILSNGKIFWLREVPQGAGLFGPYVNRNHYAGLMEMLFPVVLSLFLFYEPQSRYRSLRKKITDVITQKQTDIYLLLGFSSVLIAATVFLSLSRGGIVSLCLSTVFLLLLLSRKTGRRFNKVILVVALIVLSVGWFGWEPVFERFEKAVTAQASTAGIRSVILKDSSGIIKDFPLTGTGLGSFASIYPGYRTLSADGIATHAHNDYLELLSGGGVVAFVLAGWFLVSVLYRSFGSFLKRREKYSVYLYAGSIAGIISILIHSVADFNLHIGANGPYFFFLAGLAVSTAGTRLRSESSDTYLNKSKLPLRAVGITAGVVLLASLVFNTGVLAGQVYYSRIKDAKPGGDTPAGELLLIKETVDRASCFDPLEAKYHYLAAGMETLLADNAGALRRFKKAVRLDPANGKYLQRLGMAVSGPGQYETADRLLRAGVKYDISNPARGERYALWLLSRGEKESGMRNMKGAMSLAPEKTNRYIAGMVLYGLSDDEIFSGALPERVEPHMRFAGYLYDTGRTDMADDVYRGALRYLKNDRSASMAYFRNLHKYYMKRGRYDNALEVMQTAVEVHPGDAWARFAAAGLYARKGMTRRAIEEYERGLLFNPGNRAAKARLDRLTSKTKQ